jgi:hypothetical protein
MAETRIQTVKDLASSRFDWEQAMRDVSRAIPADVTLSSLTGSVSTASGGGSSVRGSIAAPALELKGCTSGQKQVATLLSRLRNVDGVTRVSLSKSLKPAAATGTVSAPTEGGCGKGRPPAFEVVAFFEGSKVPATVQDLTVEAAAASATPAAGTAATPSNGATATPTPTPSATPQGGGS